MQTAFESETTIPTQHLSPAALTRMAPEVWRDIPGFPGFEVSTKGHVRNAATGELMNNRFRDGVHLPTVRMSINGVEYERSIPSLVRRVFGELEDRKLDDAQVIAMRKAASEGVPVVALARQFTVAPATVRRVIDGKTYAQVGGPLRSEQPEPGHCGYAPKRAYNKVSPETVAAIKADLAAGKSKNATARRNGVSWTYVHFVATGKIRRNG